MRPSSKLIFCPVSADPGTGCKSNLFIMVKSIFCAVSVAAAVVASCIILGGYGLLLSLFVVGCLVAYNLEQEQEQEQTQESK